MDVEHFVYVNAGVQSMHVTNYMSFWIWQNSLAKRKRRNDAICSLWHIFGDINNAFAHFKDYAPLIMYVIY